MFRRSNGRSTFTSIPSAPVNFTAPAVTGDSTYGGTLTATAGSWAAYPSATFTYQWQRDGVDIGGETAATHVVVEADLNTDLTCIVTATNSEGSDDATSNTVDAYDPSVEATALLDMWAPFNRTTTGAGTSSWKDRLADTIDFVQGTDANRPPLVASWSNGKPAIDFDGTNDTLRVVLGADELLAANADVWAVFFGELDAIVGTGPTNSVIDFGNGRLWLMLEDGTTAKVGWFDAASYKGTTVPSTGKHCWIWSLDHGALGTCYEDGVSLGTASFTGLGLGGGTNIGSIDGGGVGYLNGKVARLIVGTGLLDAAAVARIHAWGQTHYGLP